MYRTFSCCKWNTLGVLVFNTHYSMGCELFPFFILRFIFEPCMNTIVDPLFTGGHHWYISTRCRWVTVGRCCWGTCLTNVRVFVRFTRIVFGSVSRWHSFQLSVTIMNSKIVWLVNYLITIWTNTRNKRVYFQTFTIWWI